MNCSGFVMVDEADQVLAVSVDGAEALVKAHVKGYTRNDGTYVKEHDTKAHASHVVKVLRSPDFGMTPQGGNGRAMLQGDDVVLHDPAWAAFSHKGSYVTAKEWQPGGTYHEYFKDEHGLITDPVPGSEQHVEDSQKYQGMGGYHELRLRVSPAAK